MALNRLHIRKTVFGLILSLSLLAGVPGCGQKGPLYLPQSENGATETADCPNKRCGTKPAQKTNSHQ